MCSDSKKVAAGLRLQPGHFLPVTTTQTYRCSICGHVCDEKIGDAGTPPGTAFEDLSDDWRCPVRLAEKSRFSPFVSPLARLGL